MGCPADLQLERIRLRELAGVLERVPAGARILEVGAGSGFQARALVDRGFSVDAVDLPSSPYAAARVFPVRDYDGHHLPFEDQSFDLVFSSNVLEHIAHVRDFLQETRRVRRPGALEIHIVPTATWRIWKTLSLHPYLAKRAVVRLRAKRVAAIPKGPDAPASPAGQPFHPRMLIPARHGEYGNACSEIYLFSRYRWRALFRSSGLRIEEEKPTRLFYTGSDLLGDWLSLDTRRALSRVLGSSGRGWVLASAD